jgi:transglutaminase-like putative cysteine protease
MIYRIRHTTTYSYSDAVSLCNNVARLTPREGSLQATIDSELKIEPFPAVTSVWVDYFGNPATFFAIQEPHEELVVTAYHVARVTPYVPPDAEASPPWEAVRDALRSERTPEMIDAYQFAFDSPYIRANAELRRYADFSFPPGRPLLAGALDLTKRIHADFKYDPRATTVSTPLAEVLANRRGVCQDFAHLGIGCLRSLGLAARYVSGYMCTVPPPGRPRLVGADASHAWLAVYCPGHGWVNFDPTNNQIPTDKHIHVAWGRDFEDVSPIKGVILGGGQHTVKVAVDVVPDEEPPR